VYPKGRPNAIKKSSRIGEKGGGNKLCERDKKVYDVVAMEGLLTGKRGTGFSLEGKSMGAKI